MDRTEPRPRSFLVQRKIWEPVVISKRYLAAATVEPHVSFLHVLEHRRSERCSRELSPDALAELLWHGARVRETGTGRLGFPWQHRAAPSGGGIHPIEVFVHERGSDEVQLYDPLMHALLSVETLNKNELLALDEQVTAAIPTALGTILILVADSNRSEAAYEHSDSLVWRDAGSLMMTLQLVAEYLGLAFCPVGVLGTALVNALGLPAGWLAAGTCVAGSRIDDDSSPPPPVRV